jgi:ketosteroid isomerase-like protein
MAPWYDRAIIKEEAMRIARRSLACWAVLVLSVAFLSWADTGRAQSGDEAAVNDAIKALTQAMLAADKAKLESLVADQLSYGHSSGKLENKAQFVEVIAGKKTVYKTINLTDTSTAVVGNNAIARHTFSAETEADGKAGSARVGVLQVWQKQDGRWKLLARQAFRLPS